MWGAGKLLLRGTADCDPSRVLKLCAATQALVKAYGADAVRYYFMAEIEFGKDGDFSEERFRNKVGTLLSPHSKSACVPKQHVSSQRGVAPGERPSIAGPSQDTCC